MLLQQSADSTTRLTREPPNANPRPLALGDSIRVDFGPLAAPDWNTVLPRQERVGPLVTDAGESTFVFLSKEDLRGSQEGGAAQNDFMWPAEVSQDSVWLGSFEGHEAAREITGHAIFEGLADGAYRIEIFGSRSGDDAGAGRLVRFAIGEDSLDYDTSDNESELAVFDEVRPEGGLIDIVVAVSPLGTARFAHLGAVVLTRTGN